MFDNLQIILKFKNIVQKEIFIFVSRNLDIRLKLQDKLSVRNIETHRFEILKNQIYLFLK